MACEDFSIKRYLLRLSGSPADKQFPQKGAHLLENHLKGGIMPCERKELPTYDLEAFKATCSSVEKLIITGTAISTAAELGFTRVDIVKVIQTMERSHFYKSMTSFADHTVWQDVYHVPSSAGLLYVKFTSDLQSGFRLLSFKEKDDG